MSGFGARARALTFACALAPCACRGARDDAPDLPASPQASAEPAPLAALAPSTATGRDAGARETLRADRPVSPDPLTPVRASPGEGGAAREVVGLALELVVHATDVAPAYRAPEVSAAGLEAARRRTEPRVRVELAGPRARFVLDGAWPLPPGTDIRARADRLGHVVALPGSNAYRVAAPGALRALLGERRLDVAPLAPAEVGPGEGDAPPRLGLRVRRAQLSTRAGQGAFEIARIEGTGEGGALLCGFLVDLLNAPPLTPLCGVDEVPLAADLRWSTRGGLSFTAVAWSRRPELAPWNVAVPPVGLPWSADPLPGPPFQVTLLQPELAAFRAAEVDVPAPAVVLPADVVGGLVLWNQTDELRAAWLDGVPVAFLAPGARMRLAGLRRGRYVLAWRTVLADAWEAPLTVSVPGASVVDRGGAYHTGMVDAGAAF